MQIEVVADYPCRLGEGPLWHPLEKRLYWCDIEAGRMFRYDPSSGQHEQFYQGETVGGFTIQADGSLLLFMARGAVKTWRDGALSTLIREIPEEREARFNDVIADPAGRVFCGTLRQGHSSGRLYRLDTDLRLTPLLEGMRCPNGCGFTPDRRRMYFSESGERSIYLFDYDEASGGLSNQRVFVRTSDPEGIPDGMTVDSDGYVWSAQWGGGCVVRYTPEGREDRRISLPSKKVTSVNFGGPDFTDLYITSAGGDDRSANGPAAGALLRISAGVRGVPEFLSRIGL